MTCCRGTTEDAEGMKLVGFAVDLIDLVDRIDNSLWSAGWLFALIV